MAANGTPMLQQRGRGEAPLLRSTPSRGASPSVPGHAVTLVDTEAPAPSAAHEGGGGVGSGRKRGSGAFESLPPGHPLAGGEEGGGGQLVLSHKWLLDSLGSLTVLPTQQYLAA